jgi:hypothetical protein
VHATPILSDLRSDGSKEIIASTVRHYVEAIEGVDGEKEPGWPFAFPESWLLTSPLLYDVNGDGVDETLISTKDGELVFLRYVHVHTCACMCMCTSTCSCTCVLMEDQTLQ